MAKKAKKADDSVLLYDVVYEDGTKSSRRRIRATELDPIDDRDAQVKTLLMEQDNKLAEMSGHRRGAIKSISKSKL